jgi:hypothetical protein
LSAVTASVSEHEDDDENELDLGRTRRRQSTVVPHDYTEPSGAICAAVRRRGGHAAVAPRLRNDES